MINVQNSWSMVNHSPQRVYNKEGICIGKIQEQIITNKKHSTNIQIWKCYNEKSTFIGDIIIDLHNVLQPCKQLFLGEPQDTECFTQLSKLVLSQNNLDIIKN
jgi:hypothetical protein